MNIILYKVILTSILTLPQPGNQAYLDPGSGSFILQLLIASLVGAAFILKTYWRRITGFFRNLSSKGQDEEEE